MVTAAYHMPRALAELRQALPEVRLFPAAGGSGGGAGRPNEESGWRLEAAEYTKYLLTASGLSRRGFRAGSRLRRVAVGCRRMIMLRSAVFNVVFFRRHASC